MLGLSCCTGYSPVGARAFSLQRPLLLPSSRRVGFSSSGSSGLRCSTACGILLDQGPNPGLLHWQADSLPLSHQGKPPCILDTMARVNKLDHTILYFFFGHVVSSSARVWTSVPWRGTVEPQPLDHQGSPLSFSFLKRLFLKRMFSMCALGVLLSGEKWMARENTGHFPWP